MKSTTLTILAVTSLGIGAIQAAIITVNLTDGGLSNGDAVAGETAGAVTAGYVNTVDGRDGSAQNNVIISSLFDDSGASSGVGLTQSATTGAYYHLGTSGFTGTVANETMANFADTNGSYTITLTGVNAGVGAIYDVYLYSAREYSNTGVTRFDVNGSSLFLTNESKVGDYTETGFATQALAEANLDSGNYVKFSNVTLDTLVIGVNGLTDATNGGNLGAINGFQLVQVPEPSSAALLGLGGLALILRRRK